MNILRDVTEGIHPVSGFKRGGIAIYSAGRGRGKSIYYDNLCQEILLPMKPAPKYKFSRKWHVAEFNWQDYDAIHEWCEEQFGPHPKNPDAWCRWHQRSMGQIHFRDERDAAMFVLRWS